MISESTLIALGVALLLAAVAVIAACEREGEG